MCANYEAKDTARVFEVFTELKLVYDPGSPWKSWYPKQDVPIVKSDGTAAMVRWGLIPFWSKEPSTKYDTFNAVSETIREKPTFREPFKRRRCLMPADGFFDFEKTKPPTRYRFAMDDGRPFAMAGVWDRWEKGEPAINSCSMLTCEPNELLAKYHHRMPVILHESDWAMWLDDATSPDDLMALLKPYSGAMTATPAPKRSA